jgi:hypothetical protein
VNYSDSRVLVYKFVKIDNNVLPNPVKGVPYNQTLTTTGSQGTVTYSLVSGSLPQGLSLDATTGKISGTPSTSGNYVVVISATDNNGSIGSYTDNHTYSLNIADPTPIAPNTGFGVQKSSKQENVLTGLLFLLGISTILFSIRKLSSLIK